MTLEQFYQKLLNPPKPWKVSKVELAEDGSRVDVWLIHDTYTFLCSECHKEAPTYDHMPERVFQHLDTCESKTFLHINSNGGNILIGRLISDIGLEKMNLQTTKRIRHGKFLTAIL